MKRVTGIGGIFFKSKNPEQLRDWYRKHLGIESDNWGGFSFQWRDDPQGLDGQTLWTVFPHDTKHFEPSKAPFMINFRVEDLDWLLTQLRNEGIEIDPKTEATEATEYGKFGWIMDPDGNRIELWEPPPAAATP